jgi:hypothetical protein
MRVAAILSVMRVPGSLSVTISNAVSRAPWLYGLVSHAYTRSSLPRLCRERTTPRAVPYPAVARLPVLQIVRTRTPGRFTSSRIRAAPKLLSATLVATSACIVASASSMKLWSTKSAVAPSAEADRRTAAARVSAI